MREGSLEAPVRFPLEWQSPWFWDEAALEKEMERVFEICHGCRRCFNLCDSFPRLFDMIATQHIPPGPGPQITSNAGREQSGGHHAR